MQRSPLLVDAELVDLVAQGHPRTQIAVAQRRHVSKAVSAAIAEVGVPDACTELLHNQTAQIPAFSVMRMAERLGADASVREALLARADLPHPARQQLMTHLASVLGAYLVDQGWLRKNRAAETAREAVERATSDACRSFRYFNLPPLVFHLAESGQLTAALLFRALCVGNIAFFEEALVQLSHLPRARVYALVQDRGSRRLSGALPAGGLARERLCGVQGGA